MIAPLAREACAVTPLSPAERAELEDLELLIEKNLVGFLECGKSLLRIREARLYREKYDSFEQST